MSNLGSPLVNTLHNLGQLQDVNGMWFNAKEFAIDGYRFTNCRFDKCKLTVMSTRFELVNCHIDDETQILYGSDTLKIIKLWNARNSGMYQGVLSVYAPEKNVDGTISIKGA